MQIWHFAVSKPNQINICCIEELTVSDCSCLAFVIAFQCFAFQKMIFVYVPLCNYVPIGNVRKERKDLFFKKVIVHDLENETEAGQVPQKSERQNGWTKGLCVAVGCFLSKLR